MALRIYDNGILHYILTFCNVKAFVLTKAILLSTMYNAYFLT